MLVRNVGGRQDAEQTSKFHRDSNFKLEEKSRREKIHELLILHD